MGWRALGAVSFLLTLGNGALAAAGDAGVVAVLTVDGHASVEVERYPTTLTFAFSVAVTNRAGGAAVRYHAVDALLAPLGWDPPPLARPLAAGDSAGYAFELVLASFDQCQALGRADGDAATPGAGPGASFVDEIAVVAGAAGARARVSVTCRPPGAARRLACDGRVYFTQPDVPREHGSLVARLDGVGAAITLAAPAVELDALGLDARDGRLYAVSNDAGARGRHHLVRLDGDGEVADLGELADLNGRDRVTAATFVGDGLLLVATRTRAAFGLNEWALVDVERAHVIAAGPIGNGDAVDFGDWAFNPADGEVYFYDQVSARLGRFDRRRGEAALFGPPLARVAAVEGAAFAGDGRLVFTGADARQPGMTALYAVVPGQGRLDRLGLVARGGGGHDLASCLRR